MPTAIPLGDKLRVEILPQAERSAFLHTIERETPLRRCRILCLGPDANKRHDGALRVGMIVLCNILSGQSFGEEVILPSASVVSRLDT